MSKKATAARQQNNTTPPNQGFDLDGTDGQAGKPGVQAAPDLRPPSPQPPLPDPIARPDDSRSSTAAGGDAVPTDVLALIDRPKTKPAGGMGLGGRELVVCETHGELVVREPRHGDDERPRCPNCSNDSVAVLCGAKSSPTKPKIGATTWYYCPVKHCTFSTEILRTQLATEFVRRQRGKKTATPPRPHITRP